MLGNKKLDAIYHELEAIAKEEQMKLFRMARMLKKHGGSDQLVNEIYQEAWSLTKCPVEYLIDPFRVFKFAFKN